VNEQLTYVPPAPPAGPHVYRAIAEVTALVGKAGISKDRRNTQQGYQFRGIDDVYNALSGAISAAGLCLLPRVTSREVTERTTKSGSVLFYVVCGVDFDLVSAADGSRHTVHVVGEAMDSGDKATNKAMSAAYKYMAMQVFCIPTEGDNDADATTHDKISPRPDTSGVDPAAVAKYVQRAADIGAQDLDDAGIDAAVFVLHRELAPQHDLYVAVMDALVERKLFTQAGWKSAIKNHHLRQPK
jgi:hypothetical protein